MIENKINGLLGLATKAGKLIAGFDIVYESVERKKVRLVIVSTEASEKTKKNIKYICDKNNVDYFEYGKIDSMSKAIGKENKAIIGIKDKNFAMSLFNVLDGGDLIG